MTKLKYALLATIAGLATIPAFATEPTGPYINVAGGISFPEGSGVDIGTTAPLAPTARRTFTFDNGYVLSGAAGYRFDGGLRTEAEVNYRHNTMNDIGGFPAVGKQAILGVMGNLLYDIGSGYDIGSLSVTPYIGAGFGGSWNKWTGVASTQAGSPTFTDRDFAWQWQMIGGVSIPVSEQVTVFTEYRYMGTIANRFDSVPAGLQAIHHSARSHNLLAGVRFNFGSPAMKEQKTAAAAPPPPPPPAPPAPPAPPPPPPVPQKFLVFFDFDKSNLRTDAQKIVTEAADYAKKNGKATIKATGHADTSGPAPYNMALSERRAKAVKAALLKMGFKDSEVIVMFKGESQPLVATGDGVKEPQNRRVEIVLE